MSAMCLLFLCYRTMTCVCVKTPKYFLSTASVLYYYFYKRTSEYLGDPRLYEDSPWLRELFAQVRQWSDCSGTHNASEAETSVQMARWKIITLWKVSVSSAKNQRMWKLATSSVFYGRHREFIFSHKTSFILGVLIYWFKIRHILA